MSETKKPMVHPCNFMGVKPIMVDLPYPPIQVKEKNQSYANLLSIDYCGAVSELSAITQYINAENRLSYERCPIAKTILGIAIAEMIHLQKLAELMVLLGGEICYVAKYRDGKQAMWTPEYLTLSENVKEILLLSIKSEKDAIKQYKMHHRIIKDSGICAVLERIIKDEEYHIMILQTLLGE